MNYLQIKAFKRVVSLTLLASGLSASLSATSLLIAPQSATAKTTCNCSNYLGQGYCTDYIRTKLGNKTSRGDAQNFPTNTKTPTANSVAVFKWRTYGHVAWVESVDNNKKTFTVSHWNYGKSVGKEPQDCCSVTKNFGKVTKDTFSFNQDGLVGFYDPNKR